MRVSILVMFSLVSMGMCQRVPFRDSMMGSMLSQGVQGARSSVGSLMGIMSTIGSGMRKIVSPGSGSRRQNGRPRGGNSGPPNLSSGPNDFVGPNGGLGGPNLQNGPRQQRRRPQRQQRRRPQQENEEFVPQQNDGVQRLSGAEINGFAGSPSSSHFKVRQQPRLRLQKQPNHFL